MKRITYAALGLLASTAAHATTYTITDVAAVYPDNSGIVDISPQPGPPPWVTPMIVTTAGGEKFFTYCDDLGHDVTISAGQHLSYKTGLVTRDGEGDVIPENISNMMGQLAYDGLEYFQAGNKAGAEAAQLVIWNLEYDLQVTPVNQAVRYYTNLLMFSIHDDGTGYAEGLISLSGTQSLVLPSWPIDPPATPESSTWAMMLIGFLSLGFAGRQTIKQRIS